MSNWGCCDVADPVSTTSVVPHNSDRPLQEVRESAFFARPTGTYTPARGERRDLNGRSNFSVGPMARTIF